MNEPIEQAVAEPAFPVSERGLRLALDLTILLGQPGRVYDTGDELMVRWSLNDGVVLNLGTDPNYVRVGVAFPFQEDWTHELVRARSMAEERGVAFNLSMGNHYNSPERRA